MEPNPYESPKATGSGLLSTPDNPWHLEDRNWIKDRLALVLTGIVVHAVLIGGVLLYSLLVHG